MSPKPHLVTLKTHLGQVFKSFILALSPMDVFWMFFFYKVVLVKARSLVFPRQIWQHCSPQIQETITQGAEHLLGITNITVICYGHTVLGGGICKTP